MTKMRRCTVTLPEDLVVKLDKISALSRISRSALISGLLGETVETLDLMLQAQADPSPEGLKRFRDGSVSVVREKVAELQRLLNNDLFSGLS